MAYKYYNPCVFQVPIKLEVPIVLDLAVAAKPKCFTKYEDQMELEQAECNGTGTESPEPVIALRAMALARGKMQKFTTTAFAAFINVLTLMRSAIQLNPLRNL
ncbi:MAG: hypothetical protein F6K55_10670 [Moorea sp. SIO4A3]|nr:hypothetical protein [Moorena sp. SIO4A3]